MPFNGWYGMGFGFGADDSAYPGGLSDDDFGLLILSVLDEGPAPGYELALALEERSDGSIPADPELIYPLLQLLLDREMIAVATAEETKKVYELTERGRERVEKRARRIDALWRRARRGGWAAWDDDVIEAAMGSACRSVRAALREVERAVDQIFDGVLGCCGEGASHVRSRWHRRHGPRCC